MENGDSFETTLAAAPSRRQSPPPVRPNLLFPFTIHHSPVTGRPPLSCRTSPTRGEIGRHQALHLTRRIGRSPPRGSDEWRRKQSPKRPGAGRGPPPPRALHHPQLTIRRLDSSSAIRLKMSDSVPPVAFQ